MKVKPGMTLEQVCMLAAEVEASNDDWRPVKMQRYDWGWRLHVEMDVENTMSLAWYKPWADWLRQWQNHEAEEDAVIVDLEIAELI